MGFAATMIFYHVIGLGVATAVFLSDSRQGRLLSVFRLATAVVFWPLYLPIVLAGRGRSRDRKLATGRNTTAMPCPARFRRLRPSLRRHLRVSTAGSSTFWRTRPAGSTSWARPGVHRPTGFARWTVCSAERSRRTTSRCPMFPGRAQAIATAKASRLAARISPGFERFETEPTRT